MFNMNMSSTQAPSSPGRGYRYYTGTPLWPFGYGEVPETQSSRDKRIDITYFETKYIGLSYTTFAINWINGDNEPLLVDNVEDLFFRVIVNNTGSLCESKIWLVTSITHLL